MNLTTNKLFAFHQSNTINRKSILTIPTLYRMCLIDSRINSIQYSHLVIHLFYIPLTKQGGSKIQDFMCFDLQSEKLKEKEVSTEISLKSTASCLFKRRWDVSFSVCDTKNGLKEIEVFEEKIWAYFLHHSAHHST